jgi:hypothetical protein
MTTAHHKLGAKHRPSLRQSRKYATLGNCALQADRGDEIALDSGSRLFRPCIMQPRAPVAHRHTALLADRSRSRLFSQASLAGNTAPSPYRHTLNERCFDNRSSGTAVIRDTVITCGRPGSVGSGNHPAAHCQFARRLSRILPLSLQLRSRRQAMWRA